MTRWVRWRSAPTASFWPLRAMTETVRLWKVGSGQMVTTLSGHRDIIKDVDWSADGNRLATAASDGVIIIWEMPSAAGILRPRIFQTPPDRPGE